MSRWFGVVGYGITSETSPGVWTLNVLEYPYYGDLNRQKTSPMQGEGLNDDIELRNDVSILADAYAYQNYASIRYVTIMGVRWKVKSVEVQRPRLVLSIGGVYNGPTPETTGGSGESSDG